MENQNTENVLYKELEQECLSARRQANEWNHIAVKEREKNEKVRRMLGELKFEAELYRDSIFNTSLYKLKKHADFMLHKINSILEDGETE